MPAISSTVSGTQPTSRRNHSYGLPPDRDGRRQGRRRGPRDPRRTPPGRRRPRVAAERKLGRGGRIDLGQRLGAGVDAPGDAVELGHGQLGELPRRAGQRVRRVRQGGRDGAEQPHHLRDPGRVDAGPQQGVEDRARAPGRSRTAGCPAPAGCRSPTSPGPSPTSAAGGRRGRAPRPGGCGASSAWNAASSSRRRPTSPASTSGSQPGGRSSRGMSSRVLGCWRARQAQNRSPRSSSSRMPRALSREGTFAQRPARDARRRHRCHALVAQLQQNMLDLPRASVGTFAYLCVSRLAMRKGEEGLCDVISGWHRGA